MWGISHQRSPLTYSLIAVADKHESISNLRFEISQKKQLQPLLLGRQIHRSRKNPAARPSIFKFEISDFKEAT
jgi:hypothetical protein